MRSIAPVGLFALLAACASASEKAAPAVIEPNPPGCAEVVERHRRDPSLPVERPPEVRSMELPSRGERRPRGAELVARMLVLETGAVDPESIEVTPPAPEGLRQRIARFRFRPARAEGCWVPAWFEMRLSF